MNKIEIIMDDPKYGACWEQCSGWQYKDQTPHLKYITKTIMKRIFNMTNFKSGATYTHICTGERINFIGMDGDDYVCKVTSGLIPEDFSNTTDGYRKFSKIVLLSYFREVPEEEWTMVLKKNIRSTIYGPTCRTFPTKKEAEETARFDAPGNPEDWEAVRIVRE